MRQVFEEGVNPASRDYVHSPRFGKPSAVWRLRKVSAIGAPECVLPLVTHHQPGRTGHGALNIASLPAVEVETRSPECERANHTLLNVVRPTAP